MRRALAIALALWAGACVMPQHLPTGPCDRLAMEWQPLQHDGEWWLEVRARWSSRATAVRCWYQRARYLCGNTEYAADIGMERERQAVDLGTTSETTVDARGREIRARSKTQSNELIITTDTVAGRLSCHRPTRSEADCVTHQDCKVPALCVDWTCVLPPSAPPPRTDGCTSHRDCKRNRLCIERRCRNVPIPVQ